jgi:hypothetical protein
MSPYNEVDVLSPEQVMMPQSAVVPVDKWIFRLKWTRLFFIIKIKQF